MLSNKMTRARMQAPSKEAAHNEVDEGAYTECMDEEVVESKLNEDVDAVPFSKRLTAHKARTQCVEKNLECAAI